MEKENKHEAKLLRESGEVLLQGKIVILGRNEKIHFTDSLNGKKILTQNTSERIYSKGQRKLTKFRKSVLDKATISLKTLL